MGDLSTGQSGKIAEYFLACALMSASGGRLSPFPPASDDCRRRHVEPEFDIVQ